MPEVNRGEKTTFIDSRDVMLDHPNILRTDNQTNYHKPRDQFPSL